MAPFTIEGRVSIAFDDPPLEWDATWTAIDQEHPNLVASWTKESGRSFELDQTDPASATVLINDPTGLLDPTNDASIYFGKVEPSLQIALGAYNPVLDTWEPRMRGWIHDLFYEIDPSQNMNRLRIEVSDIMSLLDAIEMVPGEFGDPPDPESAGQIFFEDAAMDARITQVLGGFGGNANIPEDYYVVFSGNVSVQPTLYTAGESPLDVIRDAVDAEFPLGNVYTDRYGRLVVHGRLAKFDPEGTIAAGGPIPDDVWDWHHWDIGDGAAVAAAPSITGHLRRFGWNRGRAAVRNSALAYPIGATDAEIAGNVLKDDTSIELYGWQSWSKPNLITQSGLIDGTTAVEETYKFVQFIIANFAEPVDRPTGVTLMTVDPSWVGAAITSRQLTEIDISDQADFTVASSGGGGFTDYETFVEGMRESYKPANRDYDMHTVELDVSPAAWIDTPVPS